MPDPESVSVSPSPEHTRHHISSPFYCTRPTTFHSKQFDLSFNHLAAPRLTKTLRIAAILLVVSYRRRKDSNLPHFNLPSAFDTSNHHISTPFYRTFYAGQPHRLDVLETQTHDVSKPFCRHLPSQFACIRAFGLRVLTYRARLAGVGTTKTLYIAAVLSAIFFQVLAIGLHGMPAIVGVPFRRRSDDRHIEDTTERTRFVPPFVLGLRRSSVPEYTTYCLRFVPTFPTHSLGLLPAPNSEDTTERSRFVALFSLGLRGLSVHLSL